MKDVLDKVYYDINTSLTTFKTYLNSLQERIQDLEGKVREVDNKMSLGSQAVPIVKQLSDRLIQEEKRIVENLITFALQSVYGPYKFKLEILETSKSIKPFLYNPYKEQWVTLPGRVGGGIVSFIEFIFNVYIILKNHKPPVIFLDEQFAMVDEEALDRLCAFIKVLTAPPYNFMIALVTHNEEFTTRADKHYHLYTTDLGDAQVMEKK